MAHSTASSVKVTTLVGRLRPPGHLVDIYWDLLWYFLLDCVECGFLGIPLAQCIPSKLLPFLPFGRIISLCMSHFRPADFFSPTWAFIQNLGPKFFSFKVSFSFDIFQLTPWFSLFLNNFLYCCHGTAAIERIYQILGD